jgi:hypothetical protein
MQDEKPNFAGMTTNERLFAAKLLDQFDDAVRQGDVVKMIELLTAVDLSADAPAIAEAVLRRLNSN